MGKKTSSVCMQYNSATVLPEGSVQLLRVCGCCLTEKLGLQDYVPEEMAPEVSEAEKPVFNIDSAEVATSHHCHQYCSAMLAP